MNIIIEAIDDKGSLLWSHGRDKDGQRCGVSVRDSKTISQIQDYLELALSQVKFEIKCLEKN